jgi:membrane fusion protein, multidrug efflux system
MSGRTAATKRQNDQIRLATDTNPSPQVDATARLPGAPAGRADQPDTDNAAQSGEVAAPTRSKKTLAIAAAGTAAALVAAYVIGHWLLVGRFIVSTDDAYLRADMAIIAPKVSGYVASLNAQDNDRVKAGDVLLNIDPEDYKLAVDSARTKAATQDAAIARFDKQIEVQKAVIAQASAQVSSAEADARRAKADLERTRQLAAKDYSTRKSLDAAVADSERTQAAVINAEAGLTSAKANEQVVTAQRSEAVQLKAELAVQLAKAERDLTFTTLKAPFDGIVANRAAQLGQYVQPGTRLLALVPLDRMYVEANFKETQLQKLKPGQLVDIELDADPSKKIVGRVESLAPASGSQFSLLPPENATGNFTKIVQRVPVRISVPTAGLEPGKLRSGLSVVVNVRTRDFDKTAASK